MIETLEILPGVTLRCCRDTRFKHASLSIQFIRPMDRSEAALNALIPTVLLRGTSSCPTLRDITRKLDGLYGASVGTLVRRVGDWQTTGLYCSFMEDRFALPGDQVLEPLMDFLRELLTQPQTQAGCFRRDYVEGEKKNLISTIEAQLNDKREYAMNRLLKSMCRGDSYGIPRLGEKEAVAAITPESAWAHYQKILRESPVEIFYVGSTQTGAVAALLRPIFRKLTRAPQPLPAQRPFRDMGGQTVTEEMDIAQSVLCMGFTTPILTTDPEFAAMQLLNVIFGAGMTSKLFMNLREKQSLCYAIGSSYGGAKGILTVSAGIDASKEVQTREGILEQLRCCREGQITPEELVSAKESLLSTLRSTHDSPGSIEGYYATAALSGLTLTPAAYMKAVEAVTLEQIVAAAQTLGLHSSFILKGVQ